MGVITPYSVYNNIFNRSTGQTSVFGTEDFVICVEGKQVIVGLPFGNCFYMIHKTVSAIAAKMNPVLIGVFLFGWEIDVLNLKPVYSAQADVKSYRICHGQIQKLQFFYANEIQTNSTGGIQFK